MMVPLKEQAAGMDKNEVTNEPQSFVSDFLLFLKKKLAHLKNTRN